MTSRSPAGSWRTWASPRCPARASTPIPRPVPNPCASISPGNARLGKPPPNGCTPCGRACPCGQNPYPRGSTHMHKPRRSSLGPFGIAMALSLLLGFGFARALSATDDLRSQLDLFSQVLYTVQNNYVEQPDSEKLIKGAIDGMLKTLDPHTTFLPKQRAAAMDENFRAEYSGIGVQFDIVDNKIVVLSPIEGTPAYRLGIRAGDKIVQVDGKPLKKG